MFFEFFATRRGRWFDGLSQDLQTCLQTPKPDIPLADQIWASAGSISRRGPTEAAIRTQATRSGYGAGARSSPSTAATGAFVDLIRRGRQMFRPATITIRMLSPGDHALL